MLVKDETFSTEKVQWTSPTQNGNRMAGQRLDHLTLIPPSTCKLEAENRRLSQFTSYEQLLCSLTLLPYLPFTASLGACCLSKTPRAFGKQCTQTSSGRGSMLIRVCTSAELRCAQDGLGLRSRKRSAILDSTVVYCLAICRARNF